jgi:hypothetical protein
MLHINLPILLAAVSGTVVGCILAVCGLIAVVFLIRDRVELNNQRAREKKLAEPCVENARRVRERLRRQCEGKEGDKL